MVRITVEKPDHEAETLDFESPAELTVGRGADCACRLEFEQMEVITAATGEEAMEIVQSRRFDLFILDLRLPKRHGAEIAYYIHRHGVHRFIVAIGASLDEWQECDLYDCGFTHLLKKPFPLEKLAGIARDVIQSIAKK